MRPKMATPDSVPSRSLLPRLCSLPLTPATTLAPVSLLCVIVQDMIPPQCLSRQSGCRAQDMRAPPRSARPPRIASPVEDVRFVPAAPSALRPS
jgi:hypothetical protein